MSKPWTTAQLKVMREYACFGVERVRKEIFAQTGAKRTVYAIQVKASRDGVSLASFVICPACGQGVKTLKRSGVCEACAKKAQNRYNAAKQARYRARKKRQKITTNPR